MRSTVSKRGVRGGKRLDVNQLRDLIAKMPMVTALGVVRKFPGETSHFEVSTENGTNEILVDVELIPSGERVQCRLGFGNDGVYRIPRVNSEVAVMLPFSPQSLIKDSLDFEPIIVGVVNTDAHSDLTDDETVVIEANKVIVVSGDTKIGSSAATEKMMLGTSYTNAESTFLTALNTFAVAINTYAVAIKSVADPSNAATPALTTAQGAFSTALSTFQSALSSYLATKAKIE